MCKHCYLGRLAYAIHPARCSGNTLMGLLCCAHGAGHAVLNMLGLRAVLCYACWACALCCAVLCYACCAMHAVLLPGRADGFEQHPLCAWWD